MRSKSCLRLNFSTISAPNVNETPRSLSAQPLSSNYIMRLNLEKKSRIPDVGVGVSPENIAKKTSVRNISRSQNSANLLHRVQIGRQSTMDAEDLVINDGSNGKAVENHVECLPQLEGVTTLALVVETVNSVDGRALVVATKHEEVLGVLNLVGKQEADALETLRATIDVVSKEQVVGLGREATVLKKTQEIRVLACIFL
mmetsp:Transcript_59058/g.156806  ORF Transcript_59058/g.156806 Transcript_59058/m.156806 type:complete len:200 (+) Transcript_59058:690-1289(+)